MMRFVERVCCRLLVTVCRTAVLVAIALFVSAPRSTLAQEKGDVEAAAAAADTQPMGHRLPSLPEPLESITGDLSVFERDGHFTVQNVKVEKQFSSDDVALVWTLRANHPVLCRFVKMFFDQLRNVRFYYVGTHPVKKEEPLVRQTLHTLLFCDDQINTGAANGVQLGTGAIFQVRIFFTPEDLTRIKGQGSNRVVFSRQ